MSTILDTKYLELREQLNSVLNMLMSIRTALSGLKCSVFGVVHQKQPENPKLKKETVQVYRGSFLVCPPVPTQAHSLSFINQSYHSQEDFYTG